MDRNLNEIYPLHYDWINIFGRYFLLASLFYFVFYFWQKKKFSHLKIQADKKPKIKLEILYSLSTLGIQCLTSVFVFACAKNGHTTLYMDIAQYGKLYFVFSIVLMIFLHDTYFYWTHRLLHLPLVFKYFHQVHHRITSPSPWAAFSFHPLEAIVSVGIIPLIIFIFPVHPFALLLFLFWMTLINVMGHLGYETIPEKVRKSSIGKFHNSTSCHDIHHRDSTHNFGLYFTFWDRLMGTYKED